MIFLIEFKFQFMINETKFRIDIYFISLSYIAILPIRIETGRYRGEPVSDRLWNICSQNNVEDEYHFLLHCLKYSSLRTDFFNYIVYISTPLLSDLNCV